jgi:tetratricopeptide (TPR) repeat protein
MGMIGVLAIEFRHARSLEVRERGGIDAKPRKQGADHVLRQIGLMEKRLQSLERAIEGLARQKVGDRRAPMRRAYGRERCDSAGEVVRGSGVRIFRRKHKARVETALAVPDDVGFGRGIEPAVTEGFPDQAAQLLAALANRPGRVQLRRQNPSFGAFQMFLHAVEILHSELLAKSQDPVDKNDVHGRLLRGCRSAAWGAGEIMAQFGAFGPGAPRPQISLDSFPPQRDTAAGKRLDLKSAEEACMRQRLAVCTLLCLIAALAPIPANAWHGSSLFDADNAEHHYSEGVALQARGDLAQAIAEFRKAIELRPHYADAHLKLAMGLHLAGDLDAAIAEYRQALRLKTTDPAMAHSDLGIALAAKGDLSGAVAEQRQSIRLRPERPESHNDLGIALRRQGDVEGAIAEYQEALRLEPEYAEALNNLGNALTARNDWSGAVARYRDALGAKPDYSDAHNNLGIALAHQGDLKGAEVEYHAALGIAPESVQAHFNLAMTLKAEGDLDGAAAEYRQAIALDSGYADAHNNLGVVLKMQSKYEAAAGEFREALALRPDDAAFRHNLAAALSEGRGNSE